MSRLLRLLKLAALLSDNKDERGFGFLCTQFNSFIKKHGHFMQKNDSISPNLWKTNMDYSNYEKSPYFESISEFMEKFPGGIREWVEWRAKTKKVAIDFEDQTKLDTEYEPTSKEIEEAKKPPSAKETVLANKMIEKILGELLEDGLVSEEDVEE
jgi:hypothetical protein